MHILVFLVSIIFGVILSDLLIRPLIMRYFPKYYVSESLTDCATNIYQIKCILKRVQKKDPKLYFQLRKTIDLYYPILNIKLV